MKPNLHKNSRLNDSFVQNIEWKISSKRSSQYIGLRVPTKWSAREEKLLFPLSKRAHQIQDIHTKYTCKCKLNSSEIHHIVCRKLSLPNTNSISESLQCEVLYNSQQHMRKEQSAYTDHLWRLYISIDILIYCFDWFSSLYTRKSRPCSRKLSNIFHNLLWTFPA